ncbi:MAG TPA: WecB/TagA/CpsF family glycosyltransferase [Magnetospirillaceae bacterium]|nr:WecB/TagA/CpsF family glycosyltransferase [Magnetospirillaceae bacterium]
MDSDRVKRISLLNVPLDILKPEDLEEVIRSMFKDGRNHQIILLSLWDLLRARRGGEYRNMVNGAALVIPTSLALVRGARFLRREEPVRYMPFDFTVRLLDVLERFDRSVYLLGSSRRNLGLAEKNIRATYPRIRVVGRFQGKYPKQVEQSIIQAIRKSMPTLLLVGRGVPGRERWIPRSFRHFHAGLYLWCSDLFDVFAENAPKPSRLLIDRGLEWIAYVLRRPWKVFRILSYLRYQVLLLWYRIRGI